jgi:hypothetical protein
MKLLKCVFTLSMLATLAACNDSSTGAAGPSGTEGVNGHNALVAVIAEAPGANCPNGGSQITGGLDANGNGTLESAEINSTQYVCNGASGIAGAAGAAGNNGFSTLISVSTVTAGASCSNGGKQVNVGLDLNGNEVLDSNEVNSASFVCNGTNGSSGTNGANGQNSLMAITPEAAGANCTYGGSEITSGLDSNGNGALDTSEVTETQYLCNGAPGTAGSNGQTSLVKQIALSVGNAHCANGGTQVNAGVDANGNGILDVSEVTDTQYVCNGAAGTAGTNGINSLVTLTALSVGNSQCPTGGTEGQSGLDTNGDDILEAGEVINTSFACNGATGSTGATGADGLRSLIAMAAEPAGANCTYGGTKVTSGVDTNNDGTLQAGEVSATSYTCNGPPGPGITWIDVTTTGVQAQSNKGYLADNSALVTITLPPEPVVGDVISVTGVGAGGWKIAQNAGQFIRTTGLPGSPLTGPWVITGAPGENWWSSAASADGSHIVGTLDGATNGFGTTIFASADYGATWNNVGNGGPQGSFGKSYVASSADGSHLIDAVQNGQVFISSNFGSTWTATATSLAWNGVTSSSDGTHLAATVSNGQIWVSANSGGTWTAVATVLAWQGIASSSDGTHLAAVVGGGQIWTSADSGTTWTARASTQGWTAIASSSDGTHLAATVSGGQIYTSADSGVTWSAQASTTQSWVSISSSADGTRLAAAFIGGQIYTSDDSGVTWTPAGIARNYHSVAYSADGSHIYAAVFNGGIYASSSNRTTSGTGGSISGAQDDAIELQYVGSNAFIVLDYTSNSGSFTVQ